MADTIAESARKASAGSWRKPRMKIYDYNQVGFNIVCVNNAIQNQFSNRNLKMNFEEF